MQVDKDELLIAAAKLGISEKQAQELWSELSHDSSTEAKKFGLANVLYYLGAMIVIVAMGWIAGMAWEKLGGKGLLSFALLYIAGFVSFGALLWKKMDYKVPGGLLVTMAVCMVPLAVYGFQKWTGWWATEDTNQYRSFFHWVKGDWFFMELATILAGCLALKFFRFPFLTAPIFFALWYMSLDLPLLFGISETEEMWNLRAWLSMGFGLLTTLVAYVTDLKSRKDFAFWGYLFGVVAFWTGLSMLNYESGLNDFIVLMINIVLIILAVLLQRTVFLVFGAIGVLSYITTIFSKYFSDSIWFPVMLSLAGILVIAAGLLYHKNRQRIELFTQRLFPESMQRWLPRPKK
ncbi:MAG TPA: hypothetical protein VGP47_07105 [Parachlamydiaceae bacterium]|nr:hypothetical protein [Parachlamydiaceae bacterium]